MAATNVCWGIELGAAAIKAIKLERSGDDVKVLEYAVIPHKKTLSTPDADQADTLRVSMGQLVSQFDLTGAQIAISIPGHSAFARFAKLPPVEPKKIPDIVKFEAVQQIPFPIDEVEWDYQTFMSPDNPDVEVGIFAVMRDKVTDILAKWADVGVTPDVVTIGPVAAYNALAFDENFNDKTPGTVILDVGTTSTDLLVCEPGRVWIRTFQIGGHQFTDALVNAFKLSYAKAETLKAQAEQSKHARHVLQAMRPVFGDLAQEVQRSIGYYQSSHRDANLTRLIAMGSTVNLPGLRKYLSQQLQMEVVKLEKFNRVSVEGPAGAEFEAGVVGMATAYGLALQGLGFQHGIMVNLMPKAIVREGLWRRKTKWFAAAAGLSLAAGGVAFVRPVMDQTGPASAPKPPEIAAVASQVTQLKNKWREVESGFQTDFKAANIALLLNNRTIYPLLLDDVGQILSTAQSKAGDKPGLGFVALNTAYVGPAPVDPAAPADPASPAAHGRVRVELQVQTTRSDADRFVTETVTRWLYDNAERANRPYVIEKGSIKWELARREIPKPDAQGNLPPDAGQPPPDGGLPPMPDAPLGVPGGRPGRPGGRDDGPTAVAPPMDGGMMAPPSGGGGYADPGSGGNQNLDQLAPLPPAPPPAEPGSTLYTITIRFEAVVRPPTPPAEETKS
jgi:type IV pilus assembly protein PilM